MAISRDRLIARREELKVQLEQVRANFVAIQGAIADLEFLLKEDEDEATSTKAE